MATVVDRPSIDRIRDPAAIIKIPEIIFLLIAIICFCIDNNGSPAYVLSVLLPSLLNAMVFLIVYLLGYSQFRQTPVELLLYTYTVFALFVSSILLLSRSSSSLIASGVFCLILLVVYCGELYFAYTTLVSQSSVPSTHTTATPTDHHHHQQPTGVPAVSQGGHPNVAPIQQIQPDGVDINTNVTHAGLDFHVNPVYPNTMNYPPYPMPDDSPPQTLPDTPAGPTP